MTGTSSGQASEAKSIADHLHAKGIETGGVEDAEISEETKRSALESMKGLAEQLEEAQKSIKEVDCSCFGNTIWSLLFLGVLGLAGWMAWDRFEVMSVRFPVESDTPKVRVSTWWGRADKEFPVVREEHEDGSKTWMYRREDKSLISIDSNTRFGDPFIMRWPWSKKE